MGDFQFLERNYYDSVFWFFKGANLLEKAKFRKEAIPIKNKSGKIISYREVFPEPTTYLDFKEAIIKQSEEIKELQDKIKQLEEKIKNNSNTGSVNTFYTATSKGGKRKTQKKKY